VNAPLPALSAESLADLRREARAAGQMLLPRLQERFGLDADAALRALASHVRLPAFDMAALHALTPDFSGLGFGEAARRHCLVARDADQRVWLLLTDPWDGASRAYAAHLLGVPFDTGLAHPADLAALLARHEEGLRAMEGVGGGTHSVQDSGAESLSFASSRTVASESATLPALWKTSSRARLRPTIRADFHSSASSARNGLSRETDSFSTSFRSFSTQAMSKGLVMNSAAPARVERAAASGRRTAVITKNLVGDFLACMRSSTSIPSMPGMRMSTKAAE
jgi:general secretion pathway protein E